MKQFKKWLLLITVCLTGIFTLLAFGACLGGEKKEDNTATVTFDTCIELKTNNVLAQTVEKGSTITKPIVSIIEENPDNLEVEGWYTDKEYTTEWSFLLNTVEEDMTLYAKWVANYTVSYYLGEETTKPMWQEKVRDEAPLTLIQELSDGYDSDGFFYDKEYTMPVEEGVPVTSNLEIYIHRSEYFYFSGGMIGRRFEPVAAPSGAGSTPGSIEIKGEGEEEYAEVNFGYSTAADPYIWLRNVTVDISASQKVEVTFKNLGSATALKFYFLVWYADNTPIAGQSFNEAAACTHYYTEEQMNMTEEDEWVTVVLDFAKESINNGLSVWGNAATMVQLRIQSGYVSENEEDLSNVVLIKSIKGIADDTYISTEDSDAFKAELQSDNAEDLQAVANAQEQVTGWVFPKNNACVNMENPETGNIYEKTEGILLYSNFRATSTYVFNLAEGQNINLDELTTVTIRLKNMGYATSFELHYRNTNSRKSSYDVKIAQRTTDFVDYKLNLFGAYNYNGLLDNISIVYESAGNDNGLLIESITFSEYQPSQVVGLNFNDKEFCGIQATEDVAMTYEKASENPLENSGTNFTVSKDGAAVEKTFTSFATHGYDKLNLSYVLPADSNIEKVIFDLTVDGETKSYEFAVTACDKATNVQLPYEQYGYLTSLRIRFIGTGAIRLCQFAFGLSTENGVDFSNNSAITVMENIKWNGLASYDPDVGALKYSYVQGETPKFYFGAALDSASKYGTGNISLCGRTKMVFIYQNRTASSQIMIGLGTTNIAKEGWQTEVSQPGDSAGYRTFYNLKTNMKEDEWAAYEIDFNWIGMNESTLNNLAITCVLFSPSNSLYLRSFAVYGNEEVYTVNYDLCTDLETTEVGAQYVNENKLLAQPNVIVTGENPEGMSIVGWYTDKEYTTEWDFTVDTVQADMTLYAKWEVRYIVNYFVPGSEESVCMQAYKEGETLCLPNNLFVGYECIGYYTDAEYTNAIEEGATLTSSLNIYAKPSDYLYFDAYTLAGSFEIAAGGSGTKGTVTVEGEGEDTYAAINFGYSTLADPHIRLEFVEIDITKSQKLQFTFKNMGNASILKIYFVVYNADGNPVDQAIYTENLTFTYTYTEEEKNMTADDEWLVKTFDIDSTLFNGVSAWANASMLYKIRIQSNYVSTSPDDLSNEIWIKSIKGIASDEYITKSEDVVEENEIPKQTQVAFCNKKCEE